jgi:hypothetical protein
MRFAGYVAVCMQLYSRADKQANTRKKQKNNEENRTEKHK